MDYEKIGKVLWDKFFGYPEAQWLDRPEETKSDLYKPLYRLINILIYLDEFREEHFGGKVISLEDTKKILEATHPFIRNHLSSNEDLVSRLYKSNKWLVEEDSVTFPTLK